MLPAAAAARKAKIPEPMMVPSHAVSDHGPSVSWDGARACRLPQSVCRWTCNKEAGVLTCAPMVVVPKGFGLLNLQHLAVAPGDLF